MDDRELGEIREKIKELLGPGGVYVLMVGDAHGTRAWVDGDSRLKMRGLLEYGYDVLKDGLNAAAERIPPDQN